MAIMAGTTALVARAVGSGDPSEAAQVTRASLGLCLTISFVTAIMLWIGADSIIGLFGLNQTSQELAVTYTTILVSFTPVFAISMVLATAQRAAGDAKTPLYIGLVTNVINIFLLIFAPINLQAIQSFNKIQEYIFCQRNFLLENFCLKGNFKILYNLSTQRLKSYRFAQWYFSRKLRMIKISKVLHSNDTKS